VTELVSGIPVPGMLGRPNRRRKNPRESAMAYVLLAFAILAEVAGTTSLKFSNGFTRLWPSLGTLVGYGLSFYLLSLVLRSVPVGTAYAIWSAVGTALIATIGILFLGEAATLQRLLGIALVIVGVVILNLADARA
jgi:small multidrug resistance pump